MYCRLSDGKEPSAPGEFKTWSGEQSRKIEYGMQQNEVTISMEGDGAATPASDTRPQKERPVWMMESTVEGAVTEDNTMVGEYNNREALDSTVTCIICHRTLMCS